MISLAAPTQPGRTTILITDDDPDLLIERKPLQQLARDEQLSVFRHEDFWMGMDTYREFTQLNSMWESGDPPWKVWSD